MSTHSTIREPGNYFSIDRDRFLPNFNQQACFVRHNLAGHPLFELKRLLELARRLPPKYVRINSGAVKVNATPAEIPSTGLSTDESFQLITETNTRIMLKHIELDPEYGELFHRSLADLEVLGHPVTRDITSRVGYVFISAPNQTTPYHMDPEVNFLLQVTGHKTFYVLSAVDRSVLADVDIEQFYSGEHDSLPFKPGFEGRAEVFEMGPGVGVHIPVNHPHWVTTPNEVSISYAVTFETQETQRRGTVFAVNHFLRKRGLSPKPFGQSKFRDFVKYRGYRVLSSLRKLLPGNTSKPEHY